MNFPMFQRSLVCLIFLCHYFFIICCLGGELSSSSSESKPLFNFLSSVDPKNVLNITTFIGSSKNPCLVKLNIGIRCNSNATNIVEIKLENLNLSGTIDADSLCRLQNLRVVSLAKNRIRGEIPHSIVHCTSLVYLNLSENQLSGKVPYKALTKLNHLQNLDISNNNFSAMIPIAKKHRRLVTYYVTPIEVKSIGIKNWRKDGDTNNDAASASTSDNPSSSTNDAAKKTIISQFNIKLVLLLILGIGVIIMSFYFAAKKFKLIKAEIKGLRSQKQVSPAKQSTSEHVVKKKPEETGDSASSSELVFFVEENERFTLEDLLRADADLRSGSFSSSLFKVRIIENGVDYAVKRLKNVQVSNDEFGETLRQISNLKHPNILPLVGYRCTSEEKLVIYKYQINGSLLNLLNDYIAGRKSFSWKLRLSIACGIARGLAFIYKNVDAIPHGNLKLSNILLNEKNEPLISEHGLSKFQEPNRSGLLLSSSLGYTAPEKSLTEKGDVYSFGVILLELLTGKSIETSRIDLARWVRSMVREEWTGEVFDKEVKENEHQWAFPVLNIALMCVSRFQENRPNMVEILERIEEVMDEIEQQEMLLVSKCCSDNDGSNNYCCSLHKIIPDTWDSPGSNY